MSDQKATHLTAAGKVRLRKDGNRWHWINRPRGIDHTFTFLDESTLPYGPFEYITRQTQGDFTLQDERDGTLWKDAGIATSQADYRSLNRALARHRLSCYSFRHAFGSDLKAWITDPTTANPKGAAHFAAQVMGHRSTESLAFYGTRAGSRRRGRPPIWAVSATEADLIREKSPAYRRSRRLPLVSSHARGSAPPPPAPKQQPAPRARVLPKPRPPWA